MFGAAEAADQRDLLSRFDRVVRWAVFDAALGISSLVALSRGVQSDAPDLGPIPAYLCLLCATTCALTAWRYSRAPRALDGAPGNVATVLGAVRRGVWVARPDNGAPDVLLELVGKRGRRIASGTRGMLYRQGGFAALVTDSHTYWVA